MAKIKITIEIPEDKFLHYNIGGEIEKADNYSDEDAEIIHTGTYTVTSIDSKYINTKNTHGYPYRFHHEELAALLQEE